MSLKHRAEPPPARKGYPNTPTAEFLERPYHARPYYYAALLCATDVEARMRWYS